MKKHDIATKMYDLHSQLALAEKSGNTSEIAALSEQLEAFTGQEEVFGPLNQSLAQRAVGQALFKEYQAQQAAALKERMKLAENGGVIL